MTIPTYSDIITQLRTAGLIDASSIINTSDYIIESAVLDLDVNGDGGLTVGWNSSRGDGIKAGATLCGFVLMQNYVPTANGDGSYRYDVKFSDPVALLGKQLFYKQVTAIDKLGNESSTVLYTFSFVGLPQTIITALATVSGYTCDTSNLNTENTIISVSFDGDTIKSAAQKVADACGVAAWYTEGVIHFGSPVGSLTDEYYNRFIVLGGTKNMAKKISTSQGEEYAAVTQRLTLDLDDPDVQPGSIIDTRENPNEPVMEKLLIFDNIYPKVRMRITEMWERHCWMLDEDGERIVSNSSDTSAREDNGVWYKSYSKWYVKLGDLIGSSVTIDQSELESRIIDGTVLRIQFLPLTEGGNSTLAGREFELVRFAEATQEWESDDERAETNKFTAPAGSYRIVMNADCETILPSKLAQGLYPHENDIVTLVNVAVPEECYDAARAELLQVAGQTIAQYTNEEPATETVTTINGYDAFGNSVGRNDLGAESTNGRLMVVSFSEDLITGVRTENFGTLTQRGLVSSMVDKVEGPQTSGGSGSTNEAEKSGLQVGTMSAEQWNTLAKSGGRRGIVTIKNRVDSLENRLTGFGADLDEVQSQADQSMDIWFGTSVPHPTSASDNTSNSPASDWNTDALKQLHLEDIYYNINREASDVNGGKAWRWSRSVDHIDITSGATVYNYYWSEITDADTILALEKAADVASDGKLSGGAEKVRVFGEWMQAVEDYKSFNALAVNSDISITQYNASYIRLATLLNGGTAVSSNILNGTAMPAWLQDLGTTTDIELYDQFVETESGFPFDPQTDDIGVCSRYTYRKVWNEYYQQKIAMDKAFNEMANDAYQKVENIADDGIISAGTEKSQLLTLWKETVAEFWRLADLAEDNGLEQATDTQSGNVTVRSAYHEFCHCYITVAFMLNNDDVSTVPNDSTLYGNDGKLRRTLGNVVNGNTMPSWIGDNFANDTILQQSPISTASNYRQKWDDYYKAREAISGSIQGNIKNVADMALTTAQSIAQIAVDGNLTVDELPSIRRDFETVYRQRAQMIALATNNTTHKLIDAGLLTPVNNMLSAFRAVANYLNKTSGSDGNGGTYPMWPEPITTPPYSVTDNDDADEAIYIVGAKTPLALVEFPTMLTQNYAQPFVDDWGSANPTADNGAAFCRLWATLLTAITILDNAVAKITKGAADSAQADADTALSQIASIASDEVISAGDEKMQLLIQWKETVAERNAIVIILDGYGIPSVNNLPQGTIYDLNVAYTEFNYAYNYVVSMMNNFEWSNISEGDREKLRDGRVLPKWIGENYNDDIDLTPTLRIGNEDKHYYELFKERWGNYYATLASLREKLSLHEKYLTSLNTQALADIAADNKITQDEKNDLLRQWNAWAAEYTTLETATGNPTISASTEWQAYEAAFFKLAVFLDNPDSYDEGQVYDIGDLDLGDGETPADFVPGMLTDEGTFSLTTQQKNDYENVLLAFRTARTALLAALSTGKLSCWVSEHLPPDGFWVGDRCVWKNHKADGTTQTGTDTTMICYKNYDSNYQNDEAQNPNWQAYWRDAAAVLTENEKDPRAVLAALADRLYTLYEKGGNNGYMPVPVTYDDTDGFTVEDIDDENVNSLLARLNNLISQSFTVYSSTEQEGYDNLSMYDLFCSPVEIRIPDGNTTPNGGGETITGGVQIRMWNGEAWEYLQESTSSLLESLGNKILAIVFGSEGAGNTAAGLTVGQRFAQMLATATLRNPETGELVQATQALFGVSIVWDAEEECYKSSAKVSADMIDFEGKTINLKGCNVGINAQQIDFKTNGFAIRNNDNEETLSVGRDGNVAMKNANVQGRILASELILENAAEIPNLSSEQTMSRNNEDNTYTAVRGGKFEVGVFEEVEGNTGEYHYNPRYSIGWMDREVNGVTDHYPVLRFHDKDGKVVGTIDYSIFENVSYVADTWETRDMRVLVNPSSQLTWQDIAGCASPVATYYKFSNGYTKNGDGSITPNSGSASDGLWFGSMSISSSKLNGTYIGATIGREYGTRSGQAVYRNKCQYYVFSNGEEVEQGTKYSLWRNIPNGGEEIDINA